MSGTIISYVVGVLVGFMVGAMYQANRNLRAYSGLLRKYQHRDVDPKFFEELLNLIIKINL